MKHSLRLSSLVFIFFLFFHTKIFAALNTHEWQNSHRGYSIELIPGTGGAGAVPAEYVAAGSVYEAGLLTGWHFMHLDATGNIISERTSWEMTATAQEFRVVDIVCQSDQEFWITIQARDRNAGSENDYIYVAGVDINGNDLPIPTPGIAIKSTNVNHENLYPTHSYFADNGFLYICGYAASGTAYPNEPDNHFADKVGMFLKVDVTAPSTNFYFWNTTTNTEKDYDMALKIAPYGYDNTGTFQTFPLLVTGAANDGYTGYNPDGTNISHVLVAKFGSNGFPIAMKSIFPDVLFNGIFLKEEYPRGGYGIDIRAGVYGGEDGYVEDPDIIVLVNEFNASNPSSFSYGVIRLKNDLSIYYGQPYKKFGSAWGKQFLELHGNSFTSSSDNHIFIVGEQMDLYYGSLPADCKPLSSTNINPFITYMSFGPGWWNFSSGGFNTGMTIPNSHTVYLSSQGTSAINLDYYNGSLGAGAVREDITRLYTFASVERHYNNPSWGSNPPVTEPGMVLPIADDPEGAINPDLLTKFLSTTYATSPIYSETDCRKITVDYFPVTYANVGEITNFESEAHETLVASNAYSIFTLSSVFNNFPNIISCATGYFKPGRPTTSVDNIGKNEVSLYPNPATDVLNISMDVTSGDYNFILKDVAGKTVIESKGKASSKIQIKLPQLSTGVYIATIEADGQLYREKVTIE